MTSKICVVILNWNGWKDTVSCIKSIKSCSEDGIKLEIVVVDNASTNESVVELEKIKGITLLKNTNNLGFAGGNNVGIKYGLSKKSDYICVLNNDTEVDKNLFVDLVSFMDAHPQCGIVSPKIYFYKGFEFHKNKYSAKDLGKVIWYAGGKIDWKNVYGSNANVDEVDNGQFSDSRTDFATGACLFMRSNVAKKLNGFDEKYFLYFEDNDLSQRAKRAGYEVWFANKPRLWHKVSQASAIGGALNDYFITRNRLLFGMKYASLRAKQALIREGLRFVLGGRPWQRTGAIDFFTCRLGKGSWK